MEKKEIVTGRNPVFEYLKELSQSHGAQLHISSSAHGKIIDDIVALAKKKNIKILYEDKSFFSSLGSASSHQGVALFTVTKKLTDESSMLSSIAQEKGVIVFLDQITDPHNLGSIIGSAEALGCSCVAITKDNSAPINETVIKTSAGATAHIRIITITNAAQFLEDLKSYGFWIIGTSDHGKTYLNQLKDIKPACIVIGNEGKGMRRLTEEKCDFVVSIPLKGKISSLNASVAAGIVIYKLLNE